MLLDPFERQLDLPAATIQVGNALRRQVEMIGQKDQPLALGIFDADAPERRGEMLLSIEAGQRPQLVAEDAGRTVRGPGVASRKAQIRLSSHHEEAACLVQAMPPGEIEITAIHEVERPRLGNKQVEQRMQLDGRLGQPKRRPWKHRQAQIDRGRIQGIDRLFDFDAKRVVHVKRARNPDQAMREVGIDAPVPYRIGMGQRVARHRAAKAQMVELGGLTAQTGFDVAQTLAIGQLCERHAQKLVETGKVFDLVLSVVTGNTTAESGQRQVRNHLCKHQFAHVHRQSSQSGWEYPSCYLPNSNRDQTKS